MIIKINGKEYSFEGYNLVSSIQSLAKESYQQGRADAIEEMLNLFMDSIKSWDTFGVDADGKIQPIRNAEENYYVEYIHLDDVIECINGCHKQLKDSTPTIN